MNSLIKDSAVEYAFLVGSRLWGTFRQGSDSDYYVILHNNKKITVSDDCTVLCHDEWLEKVKNGDFMPVICMFLPRDNVLKGWETYDTFRKTIQIDYVAFKRGLQYRMDKDCKYIAKNTQKGKLERATKTRKHSYITQFIGDKLMDYLGPPISLTTIGLRDLPQYLTENFFSV